MSVFSKYQFASLFSPFLGLQHTILNTQYFEKDSVGTKEGLIAYFCVTIHIIYYDCRQYLVIFSPLVQNVWTMS